MFSRILISGAIIGGVGGILGLGLSVASKLFHVEVDEKVKKIRSVLPGANCGACGYVGCDAFSEGIASGDANVNDCPVGGSSVVDALAEIMGVSAGDTVDASARVLCNGRCGISSEKFNYVGIDDCSAAASLYGGHKSCTYGCLGHGDCVKACPFGAIMIVDGVAKVIDELCRTCGKCLEACPKQLIELIPRGNKYSVVCRSKDKGPISKKNCQVACIGCRLCVKNCPHDAITMEGFLAKIDPNKCTNCGECEKVCPTKAIRKMEF